jgi:glycine betaine/proline transport system substrate-binding protein
MNVKYKMAYLTGGDDVFGPNLGEAKVFTAISPDYETRCPNVGKLLHNLRFTTTVENRDGPDHGQGEAGNRRA